MASRKQRPSGKSKPLGEYRRKRNFEQTREPAGTAHRPVAGVLRYVIQKHAASHLHFDLRLEAGGVMRSWAVPKGPSLDPAVKRLAMQVEDHPIEYNTFEGTIPRGQYGGGTVMLWDRGTYTPDDIEPSETADAAVQRALGRGRLRLTFQGERLQGSFSLVRTGGGEKPRWLFFKSRDGLEDPDRDITEEVVTSVATGRTMAEIAGDADRVWQSNRPDRRASSDTPEAKPDAAPPELAPQRPRPLRRLPEGDWLLMPWHGGESVLVFATPEGARALSVRGDTTRSVASAAAALSALATRAGEPFILAAERDADGGLHVEDLLMLGDTLWVDEPAKARRKALEGLFRRRRVKNVRVKPASTSPDRVLRQSRREGWAGILARAATSPYRPGMRNDDLVRVATS